MEMQMSMFNDLTLKDIKELGAGKNRVLRLMLDYEWHSAEEIRSTARGSEGLRRLRELRPTLDRAGYRIEKRRIKENSRHYEYRLHENEDLPLCTEEEMWEKIDDEVWASYKKRR